jgi:hypothetical protein
MLPSADDLGDIPQTKSHKNKTNREQFIQTSQYSPGRRERNERQKRINVAALKRKEE